MYGEFENWLNMYGKNIMVGKNNKTLHSVLARWTSKDDDKSRKTVESKCVGSKEEKEEGYNSDWGYNLPSKTWTREEREKQNRNKGREVERADEALRGNKDNRKGSFDDNDNYTDRHQRENRLLSLVPRMNERQEQMHPEKKGT